MASTAEASEPFILDRWPDTGDNINDLVGDFADVLLPALTGKAYTREEVGENLGRVIGSPNTDLFVITSGGHVISTATLNANPILRGSGVENWIDDVVTGPDHLKRGYSKRIMDAMEAQAAQRGGYVYLTSSPDRGAARTGYEKRGYQLLNEASPPSVVFRNAALGNVTMDASEVTIIGHEDLTRGMIWDTVGFLGGNGLAVEANLRRAIASPTTSVISHERMGGIAVVNQTPIPVGMKPWVSDIGSLLEWGEQPLLDAASTLVRDQYGYSHVNHIAHPEETHSVDWQQRASGLYLRTFTDPGSGGN